LQVLIRQIWTLNIYLKDFKGWMKIHLQE
jgi:hypothetical protein